MGLFGLEGMLMPDGKTHIKIFKFFLPVTFAVSLLCWNWFGWYLAVFVLVGALLHFLGIEPDLDGEGINRSEALWTDSIIFIPLIGWSTLYARIFRKWGGHRSIWTHSPFLSSAIRLLYFSLPFVYVIRRYYHDTLIIEFLGMYIGLSISDLWHIIADMITGEMNFGNRMGGKNRILKSILQKLFDYPKRKKG